MERFKRIGIIPYSTYRGWGISRVGSSVLRAKGLADATPDFEVWRHSEKYDALIFQKAYWKDMMVQFSGPKILDLCDPDWINGSANIVELGNLVDAITCSTEQLTKVVKNFFPDKIVRCIPDRLHFGAFPAPRTDHIGVAKKAVWFGYMQNAYETLPPLLPALRKHNIALKIVSNLEVKQRELFEGINLEFVQYNVHTAFHEIQQADFSLNPKSVKGYFKFKSNNKSLISWWLGLPVADTVEAIEELLLPSNRNEEVSRMKNIIERDFDVLQSAQEYRAILNVLSPG